MITLDRIKKAIPDNPVLLEPDFHQTFVRKLNDALHKAGLDETALKRSAHAMETGDALSSMTQLHESYYDKLEEMADEICVHSHYEIPSHRGGFVGKILQAIKWVTLQIKLRTDVQVSQQAKFNIASLLNLEILASHNEQLSATLDFLYEKMARRDKERMSEIAALRDEIDRLRSDG